MADKDRVSQVRDTLKKMQKNLECPICLELLSDPYTTQCSHPFCRVCIYTVISSNREARCPLCKEPISKRSMNENRRLGEIVEAVKQLEQAIIEDTGIPKTPPRPLPAHSHEATGSPGIVLHSLLHPSPRKPRPQSKRKKNDVNSSMSTSSQEALSIFGSPTHQEPTADMKNDTTMSNVPKRGGDDRGKLSIKRRRKKVKFSVEKPAALVPRVAKKVSSSPEVERAASSSRNLLSKFADEERMESGNGNSASELARMENGSGIIVEAASIFTKRVCPPDSGNEDRNEGAKSPLRKKAKLYLSSSPLVSAKINMTLSHHVPSGSQQFNHDVSHNILETPAPHMVRKNFTVSISRVKLSNEFAIRPEFDSNKPNEKGEKYRNNALDQDSLPQPVSAELCVHHDSPCNAETPFVQASGRSNSDVTRVMETPFISNAQVPSSDNEIVSNTGVSADGEEEQCESILANETENDTVVNNQISCTTASDEAQIQMEKTENLFSDSILAKETQDIDCKLENDQSSNDDSHTNLASDGSLMVLGPTQVTNIPESQFNGSTISKQPTAVSCQSLQIIEASPLQQKVESEHKTASQHDTSSPSESHSQGSPVQSGGTVCIGETQFAKSESKLSPEQALLPAGTTCTMPSPPVSPSGVQSPVIPLQSSITHYPHLDAVNQPSGSVVSKITETQLSTSSEHEIVPSSQPSPTASKKQPASLLLPGLTTQYCMPHPLATIVNDKTALCQEKAGVKQSPESQMLAVQRNEDGHITKSPSKSLIVEQYQNEHKAGPYKAVVPTQSNGNGAYVNVPVSSMSLAYSSLQSQRDSLQSQISSSVDLSSQQLELLRLEMEAKQREIDELEAALRQVEAEKKEDTPASTQSSVRSITAIAETMPSNGQTVSPEQMRSPQCSGMCIYGPESIKNPLSGHSKSLEHSQILVAVSPRHERLPDRVSQVVPESVANSQLSRQPRSLERFQIRESASFSSQILSNESNTVKVRAIVTRTAPNNHQIATLEKVQSPRQGQSPSPRVTTENLRTHTSQVATNDSSIDVKSAHVDKTVSSQHSGTQSDTESDISEMPCSSQSVLAALQAADEVLKKLKSPPLAVLEERSSMEIDTDLYSSGTPFHHTTSLKAKKLRISTDTAKPTGVKDKTHTSLVQADIVNSGQATLEIDSRLCANSTKEEISAKRGKTSTSTSRGKKGQTKSKSKKKKKVPVIQIESRGTSPAPPEFRNQNQASTTKSSSDTLFSGAQPPGPNPSSSRPTVAQSPDRGHCSRESGRGSTTPTYGAVVLRTPTTAQCSSNSSTSCGSGKEMLPTVSPCRPLSRVGKDHPPSYVGSGLSKTQLREVQALSRRYGGRLASCFNGSTSHVIVSADENGLCSRTVKYLQGVATGRWIISYQWVTESLYAGRLLPETDYEVAGDHVTATITRAPMRSRQLHMKESTGLFADYAFLFIGAFGSISQDHLAQLIQLSGGSLVSSIDEATAVSNSTTCVVCDEKRIHLPSLVHVKSEWILDCLSNYSVLPISNPQYRQDDP